MFGFFKKNKEREFYQRMEKCRKAWDYLSKNNPFEAIPNEYIKNKSILEDNAVWVKGNLEELKKFLDNSQLQELRRAFGFPYTFDWIKGDDKE